MMARVLIGTQEPTHKTAPDCWSNAVGEAADLMAQLGRPLDPWQRLTLGLWLGERRDGSWAAFECYCFVQRQNGKGAITEGRELGGLFLFGEQLIIHTAHKSETVQAAWRRTLELVEGSDDLTRRLRRVNRKDGEEGIELMSGAELQFRVRSGRGKGRGLSGDCLVLDEALYIKPDDLDAFGPTLLARPNAQICYTSTPPLSPSAHIMSVRDRGRAGEDRLAGAEWSNESHVDVDNPAVQAAVNPAYGTRITPERMVDMRRLLGDEGYRRECIGIWPEPAGAQWQVIPKQDWLDALDERSEIVGPLVLVVTAQRPDRSWVAITAAGRNQYGKRHAEITGDSDRHVYDYRPGTRWVTSRLVELVDRHQPLAVVVDDRQLADEAEEAGLTVYRPTAGDMVSACGMLYGAVSDPDRERRDFVHIGQQELTGAAAGADRRTVGQGMWAWEQRDVLVDVCPLTGASLGLWALSTPRIHVQRLTPFVLIGDR